MTTKAAQPSAADLRAANNIYLEIWKQSQRSEIGGELTSDEIAEIISREMEPERREMLEALEAATQTLRLMLAGISTNYPAKARKEVRDEITRAEATIAHAKGEK